MSELCTQKKRRPVRLENNNEKIIGIYASRVYYTKRTIRITKESLNAGIWNKNTTKINKIQCTTHKDTVNQKKNNIISKTAGERPRTGKLQIHK